MTELHQSTLWLTGILAALAGAIAAFFRIYYMPPPHQSLPDETLPPEPVSTLPESERPVIEALTAEDIYAAAVKLQGQDIALDKTVPNDVQCAQAVSYVLREAGFPMPAKGISAVDGLCRWMVANGFALTKTPRPGAIVAAYSLDPRNRERRHIGVWGRTHILSNTSEDVGPYKAGEFAPNYTIENWKGYFDAFHKRPSEYYVPMLG